MVDAAHDRHQLSHAAELGDILAEAIEEGDRVELAVPGGVASTSNPSTERRVASGSRRPILAIRHHQHQRPLVTKAAVCWSRRSLPDLAAQR